MMVERILGVTRRGGQVLLDPALPSGWEGCEVILREGGVEWRIEIERGAVVGEGGMVVDGVVVERPWVVGRGGGRLRLKLP